MKVTFILCALVLALGSTAWADDGVFGDSTEGGIGINCEDAYYGGLFYLDETADVDSLVVFMQISFLGQLHDCALLIYDKDSTFMGKTEERSIGQSASPSWEKFDISGSVELSPGWYTFGLSSDAAPGEALLTYRQHEGAGTDSMCYKSTSGGYYNYASPADPLLYTFLGDYQASILCYYQVVPGAETPKGRRRKLLTKER